MNTIFEMLQAEHQRVKALMGAEAEEIASLREGLLTDLWEVLHPHMRLEEELVYPLFRNHADTAREAQAAFREHREIRALLANLEDRAVETQEWEALFRRMRQQVLQHFREEEQNYFPTLGHLLGGDGVERLTQRYLAERSRPVLADLETMVELPKTPESTKEGNTW